MKKRMLATLLALCLVLSLGVGALAAGKEDYIPFLTESGEDLLFADEPTTVTMTATVPVDGTYLITTWVEGTEDLSVTSENEVFTALMEETEFDRWDELPVELTAGDYAFTAENVTILNISMVRLDNTGLPDDIPPAAERVNANFRFQDGDRSSSLFEAEEPSSVTMTATVEQDGLYLVDVYAMGNESLSLTVDGDTLAFMNQLPLENFVRKIALAELTAGEYTLQVENSTYCYVKMGLTHPLDAVDGVIGEGLYVCQLDEPMTVDYTLMGLGATADFYTGQADSLDEAGDIWLLNKNSDQTVVNFEQDTAVIDFRGGSVTSALVGSTEGVHAAAASEPIAFDFANVDENGAVRYAATVPADGYYLFYALEFGDAPISFATDLPIQMEPGTVPDWTFSEDYNGYELLAAVGLTAGDYTVTVGMTDFEAGYIANLTPVQMVDSLDGSFARGSVYMCALSEPATVTFTVDGEDIVFYGGNEGGFLQPLTPAADDGTLTVEFPAGIAVIDATHYNYTSSIIGAVS